MRSRIMYIESKADNLQGSGRVGRVRFSQDREFRRTTHEFKANYIYVAANEPYWISGPKRNGLDRLYGPSSLPVEIDDDVREEYWRKIRKKPELSSRTRT